MACGGRMSPAELVAGTMGLRRKADGRWVGVGDEESTDASVAGFRRDREDLPHESEPIASRRGGGGGAVAQRQHGTLPGQESTGERWKLRRAPAQAHLGERPRAEALTRLGRTEHHAWRIQHGRCHSGAGRIESYTFGHSVR